jgi:hypothetical protein
MQQMTMQQIWIEEYKLDRADGIERFDGVARKLWKFGWGLMFVVAMTVLSEYGPRTAYSKIPPAAPAISQPAVHSVK